MVKGKTYETYRFVSVPYVVFYGIESAPTSVTSPDHQVTFIYEESKQALFVTYGGGIPPVSKIDIQITF